MNELGNGQRTGAETYTAERKDDDFQQLRLAALERLDAPKGVPTVILPGMAPVACYALFHLPFTLTLRVFCRKS